jgi:leukotriene-A4 hydrolase
MSALFLWLLLAASAGADPHSFGNPEAVRPRHLSLDLTLSFSRKVASGSCELQLEYLDREAASHLDLDSEDLRIARILDPSTGKELPFVVEPAVKLLGERVRITLPSPRPERVRVDYETAPSASALQWLEPRQTTSGKLPFLFTQGEAIHARSWIPTMDSPGVRVTYDAVVHVPPGMNVVMSAEHLEDDPAKGVFRFRMPQPIPAYLIALAAGEFEYRPLSSRTGVYAEPAVLDRAASEFQDAEKMVQATEALYGPYAWGRWDTIVLPPSFPFGGMENPRITFATPTIIAGDRSLVSVLAHELAHSWSGNLVTNATWADFWLNEGFTTYIEGRVVEALYGKERAEMEVLLAQRTLREVVADPRTKPDRTRLAQDEAEKDPEQSYSAVAYEKGAEFLRVLEARFGRDGFDAFLRGYFSGNAFSGMTTARFLEILKRDLFKGDEEAWRAVRVEEWVRGPGLPDNMPVPSSKRFEATRAAAEAFEKTGALEGVPWGSWSTDERRDFLGSLPKLLTPERLAALDRGLGLSESRNSEVLFAWLRIAARNGYEPAFPALESFLTRQGRVKYLRPLYRALADNPRTADLARSIFEKARVGYHPIAVASVESLLSRPAATSR